MQRGERLLPNVVKHFISICCGILASEALETQRLVAQLAGVGRVGRRSGAGLPEVAAPHATLKKRTLTNLCNARPQWRPDPQATLDPAVASAYGWPPTRLTTMLCPSRWHSMDGSGSTGSASSPHPQPHWRDPVDANRSAEIGDNGWRAVGASPGLCIQRIRHERRVCRAAECSAPRSRQPSCVHWSRRRQRRSVYGLVGGGFGDGTVVATGAGVGLRLTQHLGLDVELTHLSGANVGGMPTHGYGGISVTLGRSRPRARPWRTCRRSGWL